MSDMGEFLDDLDKKDRLRSDRDYENMNRVIDLGDRLVAQLIVAKQAGADVVSALAEHYKGTAVEEIMGEISPDPTTEEP